MNQFIQFAPVLILAAFLYFVLIRPQSKQQKKVNDMLEKTSTKDAPWIVVEGNSKWYARIKVLETVADAMEKKIKEVEKNRKR